MIKRMNISIIPAMDWRRRIFGWGFAGVHTIPCIYARFGVHFWGKMYGSPIDKR